MPEHAPAPDETVRFDTGRRPAPPGTDTLTELPEPAATTFDGPAAAAGLDDDGWFDETRPVSRDWMYTDSGDGATAADDPALTGEFPTAVGLIGDPPAGTVRLDEPAPALDGVQPPPGDADDGPPPGDGAPPSGTGRSRPWWRHPAVLAPVATVAVLGGAYGVDLALAGGDIPRHTVVDGVDIGGLSPAAATAKLQGGLAKRLAAQRSVVAADVRTTLSPADAGLKLDVTATVAAAGTQPLSPWARVTTLLSDRTIAPVMTHDTTALKTEIADLAQQVDRAPADATIAFDGTTPRVVAPADGRSLDQKAAARAIQAAVARTGAGVRIPVAVAHPKVSAAAAQQVLDSTVRPAVSAPVSVVGQDGARKGEIPVAAIAASLTFAAKADGTLGVTVDPEKLQAALGEGFAGIGTPAKDAAFKVSGTSISVVPAVDGTGVDPAKLASDLVPVLSRPAPRTVTAQLGAVHAKFTTEQAQALGIKEQIGSFTTNFAPTPSGTNIRVVAAKVNGAVVKPGATFSLNDFTGPRGTAQGYVEAAVIENGRFTKAVGGGISQFATTMFNAVFFSGVQDVHHQPHSYWISRYPAGREATVFDGLIDLSWKNDAPTGVYVQTTWVQGSITVTFWGTKRYDIESVSGPRTNVVQPQSQEKPAGPDCTPMSGQEGFDITVTRVFHPVGSTAVTRKQDFHTHYKAEPILHCVDAGTTTPAGGTGTDGTAPQPPATPSARRPGRRRRG